MLWFVIQMTLYVLSLVASLAVVPVALVQWDLVSPTWLWAVLSVAPVCCWAIAMGHMVLFDRALGYILRFAIKTTSEAQDLKLDPLSNTNNIIFAVPSRANWNSLNSSGCDPATTHRHIGNLWPGLLLQSQAFRERARSEYCLA
jgi:hypothetical protein